MTIKELEKMLNCDSPSVFYDDDHGYCINTETALSLFAQVEILTKDEAYAVADHIDSTLYDVIRNDTDIDSMTWLRNIIHAYEKLCDYSGYVGMTETVKEPSSLYS